MTDDLSDIRDLLASHAADGDVDGCRRHLEEPGTTSAAVSALFRQNLWQERRIKRMRAAIDGALEALWEFRDE